MFIVSQKVVQYMNNMVMCVMTCSELCFFQIWCLARRNGDDSQLTVTLLVTTLVLIQDHFSETLLGGETKWYFRKW